MENNNSSKRFLVFKLFFVLKGVAICYFSIKGLISYNDFHTRAISTIGIVARMVRVMPPKVRDAINIVYNSQNPQSVRISSLNDLYCFDTREAAPNMMIFLAGGVALILAILFLPYPKLNPKKI